MTELCLFFLLNQYSCHCNVSRLVASDYVRFMHPLDVLIVYDWLWLSLLWKRLSYDFD